MKVLIIGGGGREHAIAVSMKKSRRVDKLYCVPGNAGIAEIAECEPSIGVMEFDKIVAYAKEKQVDLVFVAPDDPLVGGLVDVLKEAGFRVFGPDKKAAILEGSKAFSKDLMKNTTFLPQPMKPLMIRRKRLLIWKRRKCPSS